jgi:hypothetical protein
MGLVFSHLMTMCGRGVAAENRRGRDVEAMLDHRMPNYIYLMQTPKDARIRLGCASSGVSN